MRYTLQSTFDDVHQFEAELEKMLVNGKITKRTIFNIRLAFHEAIINVIQHTYKFSQSEKIIIEMNINRDYFECSIEDFGEPVNPEKIVPHKKNEIQTNGLGIFLYCKLMDEVEFSNTTSGNMLKLKKYFGSNDYESV